MQRWWRTLLTWPVLLTGVLAGVAITWLAWVAPLSYDEAYNWVTYRPQGWRTIITTYPLPNNHVPFTLLHVLVPARLVARSPWAVRMFAIGISVMLMMVMAAVAARRRGNPLLPWMLVLGSPLLTAYSFIARSYTACALLMVLAALATGHLPERRRALSIMGIASLLAVACWALPTNGFLLPGWVLVVWLLHRPRLAAIGAATYAALTAVFFAPIAGEVLEQSKFDWARGSDTVVNLPGKVSYLPIVLFVVTATVVVLRTADWRTAGRPHPRTFSALGRVAVVAGAMSISWFVVVPLTRLVGMQPMFYRNAIPTLWLVVLAVVVIFPHGRRGKALLGALAIPVVLGVGVIASAVDDGRWDRVASVLSETTPVTIRDLKSGDADLIECSSFDSPVCLIAIPMLAERSIIVSLADYPYTTDVACVKGSRFAPEPNQVWVYLGGQRLGKLCD